MSHGSGSPALTLLYACTIFVSAFLLFQVQPIIGKMILPWFGGSAAVWTTCLLFFQSLLVFGYLYSHWTIRFLQSRTQGWIHMVLLAASLAALPVLPDSNWKPSGSEDPAWLILGLLAASIGLPYFLLATTGPLLQAWFARERPGTVPYRLFALSNLGSMLALLSYPIAVEPFFPTRVQSFGWSAMYIVFALLCGTLASRGIRRERALETSAPLRAARAPAVIQYALWAALAACPTVLLMAITSHLTQNVAPIPLLWILPLSLYLLSFILCFERDGWYRRAWYLPLLVLGLGGIGYTMIANKGLWIAIPLYCATLFVCCMVCHGELAKLKPHPRYLTAFYLMIATGGALGGVFVAVLAPRVFNGEYELSIGLVATGALVVAILYRDPSCRLHRVPAKLSWLASTGLIFMLAWALAVEAHDLVQRSRLLMRNFYGALRVSDTGQAERRTLVHGTIIHGEQYLAPERKCWPTTYYGEKTGAGLAIAATRDEGPQRVGVIGLGVGTLAAYGKPGDYYRMYEINPLVIKVANSEFSFLQECGAAIDVVLGDARLSLEREPAQQFDVLLVDAFSGDSVPVHLLTREVFAQYFRHLKPDGIVAVHTSNKYLDLAPIVRLGADFHSKQAVRVDSEKDEGRGVYSASWVLISTRPDFLALETIKDVAKEIPVTPWVRPWTDDYSSLYPILKRE
jgi:SAM-dependent methyltransferase